MGKAYGSTRSGYLCLLAVLLCLCLLTLPPASAQVRSEPEQQNAAVTPAIESGAGAELEPGQATTEAEAPATNDQLAANSNNGPDAAANPAAPDPSSAATTALIGNRFKPGGGFQAHTFLHQIITDERAMWTSPFHISRSQLQWLLPLAAGTAGLLATDHRAERALPNSHDQVSISSHISQLGSPYGTFGIAGGFYLVGALTGNDKARETGLLATEVLIHSNIIANELKLMTGRPRPEEGGGASFWKFGGESMPSGHSMSAWSLAYVIAHEYGDHKFVPFAAYGLAAAVSASRVGAQKHFPSDVLVGSALGWLIGRYVYQHHKDEFSGHQLRSKLMPQISPCVHPRWGGPGLALNWDLGR